MAAESKTSESDELKALQVLFASKESASERNATLRKILANRTLYPDNLAMQCFDLEWFLTLTEKQQSEVLWIVHSGTECGDSSVGCYACRFDDYVTYNRLLGPVLAGYHKVSLDAKHVSGWKLDGIDGIPEDGKLDLTSFGVSPLSMRVRVGRNLEKFPLAAAMTRDDRVNLEKEMYGAFQKLIADPTFGGAYYSLTPDHPCVVTEEKYQELVKDHLMFKDMSADSYLLEAGISRDWPYGRGCYVSEDRQVIVWCGEEDHLRIISMQKGTLLNTVFDRLRAVLDVVESLDGLKFAFLDGFGAVTSCPSNLGTAMRASVHIQLPNLTKDGTDEKAKLIAKPLGLSVRGVGGEHTPIGADGTVDISPRARYCITEAQILASLYKGIKLLLEEEAKAAVASS